MMCWNFGAWTTVLAEAFWMCWKRFILYFGRPYVVQRVTVVKLGVFDGGGNCVGGVKVKVRDGYSEEHRCDGSKI